MQKELRENTPKSISNLQAYSEEDGILEEQKSLKEWKIFYHFNSLLLSYYCQYHILLRGDAVREILSA